jgi:hypothetical protein
MTAPIYPKSVVPWTDRVDQQDVIFAKDPNSLAAEIIALENTLGTMPHRESAPYAGSAVTYASVGARISDVLAGSLHPYCSLTATNFSVFNNQGPGTKFGQYNVFRKNYDPFGYYNGSDITIQASGLYIVQGVQSWAWNSSGYIRQDLVIGNTWMAGDMWQWNFAGSGPGNYQNNRNATTNFTWIGGIPAGQRVRVLSENGTSKNPYPVVDSWFRVYCLRKLPGNIVE